ncbi:MAG: hypothetical protein SWX82_20705 [Cyanobacteriota bacterium]|nr:hypothetical protein [Cyanobacteriota bacterium]
MTIKENFFCFSLKGEALNLNYSVKNIPSSTITKYFPYSPTPLLPYSPTPLLPYSPHLPI